MFVSILLVAGCVPAIGEKQSSNPDLVEKTEIPDIFYHGGLRPTKSRKTPFQYIIWLKQMQHEIVLLEV